MKGCTEWVEEPALSCFIRESKQCGGCRPNPLMFPRRLNAQGMASTLKATAEPAVLPATSLKMPLLLWAVQWVFLQHVMSL